STPEPALFADVILPLALPKTYTYAVPAALEAAMRFGIRVEVQLRDKRLYSGIVSKVHTQKPDYKTKEINDIIDTTPIVSEKQIQFWQWLADYYACTIGEVMIAALPANLKLASETKITLSPNMVGNEDETQDIFQDLDADEYLVAEALSIQNELMLSDIQKILNAKSSKSAYAVVNRLLEKEILSLQEELKEKFKPKTALCVTWSAALRIETDGNSEIATDALKMAFENTQKSEKQTAVLLALLELLRDGRAYTRASEVYEKTQKVSVADLRALQKKGIIELEEREVSRLTQYQKKENDNQQLTHEQKIVLADIKTQFTDKNVVLLHGITGSGKTQLYVELMKAAIARGEQVLYLLPEIALTTQIINRLKGIFGNQIAVYHSRLGGQERVELWRSAFGGKPIILGARSSLLLPFQNLGLIIVDEEHDPSFKQTDPSPRYHARDAAIYLASRVGAKVLLGTATPSVESFFHAKNGKYGLAELSTRYGGIELPEIEIVDLRNAAKNKTLTGNFSSKLVESIKTTLAEGQQIILFQNRRGFAPTLTCPTCGWNSECKNCDVTLTYHKYSHSLDCHYCGFHQHVPSACPACGSKVLNVKGFGTERIEDELMIQLPNVRIGRLDLDTARSRHAHAKIIQDFEEKRTEILVGTQMVTKGLDFENVGLVGVLSADALLHFPDFRASERALQLMMQVSGRAGRRKRRGKVLIQSYRPENFVLRDVVENTYERFFQREIEERRTLGYPPFTRLIGISLRHQKPDVLNKASIIFNDLLRKKLGSRVSGPAKPSVERVNNYYILNFLIKLENNPTFIKLAKLQILEAVDLLKKEAGYSTIRTNIDVDAY
ncbi:MAG: hypothetical protein RL757_1319, partial [Bacteroidota bacterium]